jgi:hypothetical protein
VFPLCFFPCKLRLESKERDDAVGIRLLLIFSV